MLAAASVVFAATERLPALSQQLGRARLVVEGTVGGVDEYDDGRLALAHITVGRVVKGTAEGTVTVVERRDLPSAPQLLKTGDTVLLFLAPAQRTSSMAAALPEGRHLEPVGGRNGVLAGPPAEITEATDVLLRVVAASAAPDADRAQRVAVQRALVFDEIAARHPRLVADGAVALTGLDNVARTLQPAERRRLEQALARSDLPSWVRVTLVRAIAETRLAVLAPALRAMPSPDGALQEAIWTALRELGMPPGDDEITAALASPEASTRIAGVRALAATGAPDAAERIGRLAANDPQEEVRIVAAEALGTPSLPGALPVLEELFTTGDWPLRQAAGRSITAIGGRPAQEAFARLAYSDRTHVQKYAVTLLMLTGIDQNDPLMVRIRTEHPQEDVRELASHGLPVPHTHH